MMRRSPARFLAPIALVAVVAALFMIVSDAGLLSDEEPATGNRTAPTSTTTTAPEKESTRKRGRRTYTVRVNDTPSGIAERTGVPLERILELNPDLEPDALVPGTKIKLR